MINISYLNSLMKKKVTLKLRYILYVAKLGNIGGMSEDQEAAFPEATHEQAHMPTWEGADVPFERDAPAEWGPAEVF